MMTEPMANPRTISAQGAHHSHEYGNWICLASPLPRAIDPVTGRETPYSANADGTIFWHDPNEPTWSFYAYCGDINTGDCPKYEARES